MKQNEFEPNKESYGTWFDKRYQGLKSMPVITNIKEIKTETKNSKSPQPFRNTFNTNTNKPKTPSIFTNTRNNFNNSKSPAPKFNNISQIKTQVFKKLGNSTPFMKRNMPNSTPKNNDFRINTNVNYNRNSRSPAPVINYNNTPKYESKSTAQNIFKRYVQNKTTTIEGTNNKIQNDLEFKNMFLIKSQVSNVFKQPGLYQGLF